MKTPRPAIKEEVIWKYYDGDEWVSYDVIVDKVRVRDKVAKIVRNYNKPSMPFQYFWVDFNEIGY